MILDTSIYTEFDSGVDFEGENAQKYKKTKNVQKLNENLNQEVDSIWFLNVILRVPDQKAN